MINLNGTRSVDNFIDSALYDKNYGYYTKKNPFGKKGDFITAPIISPLFSEIILIWVISYWISLGKPKKFSSNLVYSAVFPLASMMYVS